MAKWPHAHWRGPVPNRGVPGDPNALRGATDFVVVHVMQSNPHGNGLEACDAWFHNPAAQVSAHFGIGRDGTCYQWVDTDEIAWAEAAYNGVGVSIEHEGDSGESLTPVQLAVSLALQEWLFRTYPTVPRQWSMNPERHGVIPHGALGVAGGDHPLCPGRPIERQFAAAYRATTPPRKEAMTGPSLPLPKNPRKRAHQIGGATLMGTALFGVTPNVAGVKPGVLWAVQFIVGALALLVEPFTPDPNK